MDKMIHQLIEETVSSYLHPFQEDYKDQAFDFSIDSYFNGVEVTGYYKNEYKPDETTLFVLLRLSILHDCKQVHISNIFLPRFMHHRAIGKHMIGNIFGISKQQEYDLFIVDMVNSFYCRMIGRGALPCIGCDDAVQIVDTTNLS